MRLKYPIIWLIVLNCCLPGIVASQNPTPIRFFELPTSLLNPVGSGARAAGQGYAFIGVADDATAASHNPGGLVQLEEPEVSVVGSYFLQVEQPGDASEIEDQTLDKLTINFFSAVFPPFRVLQRKVVASIQIQRSFELKDKLDFSDDNSPTRLSFRRDGRLFSISPAIAVRLTPTFSVGVALNIWPDFFGNRWETETRFFQGDAQEIRSKSTFDFEGFNITAGFLWEITPEFRIGGVFRSPFDANLTHRNTISGTSRDPINETLTMEMPLSYGLGLSARLSDFLTASFDVSWVQWSDFRLETPTSSFFFSIFTERDSFDVVVLPDFREASRNDTTTVRLGIEYLWLRPDNLLIPFRAGVFYDPMPSFKGTDDFFGITFGSGIVGWKFVFDLAYTFRTGRRTKLVIRTDDTVETENAAVYEHNVLLSMIFRF